MRAWFAILMFLASTAGASAQTAIQVLREVPDPVVMRAGVVVPQPFAVRVVRASDQTPVAGARIDFAVPILIIGLPPPGYNEHVLPMYGQFVVDGVQTDFAIAITDADGRARSPDFASGITAGNYEVYASVSASRQENAGLASASAALGVLQTIDTVANVDATSMAALGLLACICIAFAWKALRQR